MTAFDGFLAAQSDQPATAGFTHRLMPRHPSEPTIDLAGNDYLGLTRRTRVSAGAVAATHEYGAGAGTCRLVCFRPPSTPDGISRSRVIAQAQLNDHELATTVRMLEDLL